MCYINTISIVWLLIHYTFSSRLGDEYYKVFTECVDILALLNACIFLDSREFGLSYRHIRFIIKICEVDKFFLKSLVNQ